MAPIGVAIIGSGIFAKEEHLPGVAKTDLLTLKAIFSRSLKSAKDLAASAQDASGVDLYSTDAGEGKAYKDLLARDDISAVIIALPINNQPEYIEAALSAGKHVLAEKPIARDVDTAKKLIEFWKKTSKDNGAGFAIAENFRYMPAFHYAAEKAKEMGRITHFNVRVLSLMDDQNRFFQTAWRKEPEFQGGFVLDGGVHFAAAARHFLRGQDAAASVQAFTAQVKPHLPPLDSVHALVKLQSGAAGVFQHSCGSTLKAFEWAVAFEKGSVVAEPKKVVVSGPRGDVLETKDFERTSGVSEEIAAWAEALQKGTPDKNQSPEEALADLEFLEKIFRSGEKDGAVQKYELQL